MRENRSFFIVVLKLLHFLKLQSVNPPESPRSTRVLVFSINVKNFYCKIATPPSYHATALTCLFYFLYACLKSNFMVVLRMGFYYLSRIFFRCQDFFFFLITKVMSKITVCSFVGWKPRKNRFVFWIGQTFMTFRIIGLLICIFKTDMTLEP